MDKSISLGCTIALMVFLIFGIIWGFIRGAKKTTSRGLFLLLTSVGLLFLTPVITKALCGIHFNVNTNINGNIITGTFSITELIQKIMELYLEPTYIENNPMLIDTLVAIPLTLINSIIYVLLFWILKIILLPINSLFNLLIFPKKKIKEENLGFAKLNNSDNNDGKFINKDTQLNANTESTKITINPEIQDEITKNTSEKVKKKKEKKKKTVIKKEKEKKHRIVGAVLGSFVGFLVMLNTIFPVYGIINIIQTNKDVKIENLTNSEISASSLSNGITDNILKGYNESYLSKFSNAIGFDKLALAQFDQITTKTINDEKVVLRDDINNLIKSVKEIDKFWGFYKSITPTGKLSKINQTQLDNLISYLENALKSTRDVKLINIIGDYIIPISCEYLKTSNFQLSNNIDINDIFNNTLSTFSTQKDLNIITEVITLINFLKYTNEQKILLPIINNDKVAFINSLLNCEQNFAETLTTKLFTLKSVSIAIPNLVNMGLAYVDEITKFGFEKIDADAKKVKTDIDNIVSNIVSTAKTLNTKSSAYITTETLIPMGKLLNTMQKSSFLSENTFQNLLDYALSTIRTTITNLFPKDFHTYVENTFLGNFKYVDNWENEMNYITSALEILRNNENGIIGSKTDGLLREGFNFSDIKINEPTLNNIGSALDVLENTKIFGGRTKYTNTNHYYNGISKLLESVLNFAKNEAKKSTNENFSSLESNIESIKNNLSNLPDKFNKGFWTTELKSISPLISTVYNMINTNNIEINDTLALNLDKAKNSLLLGGNTTLKLMDSTLKIVKTNILGKNFTPSQDMNSINDKIYNLFNKTSFNLNSKNTEELLKETPNFWENEMKAFISLKNLSENVTNIKSIEEANNYSKDLDKIFNSKIIDKHSINTLFATCIQQVKLEESSNLNKSINTLLNNISNTLSSDLFDNKNIDNFWSTELNHLKNLNNIDFTTDLKSNLTTIGKTLDNIIFGIKDNPETETIETINASKLIKHKDIRNIIATAITDNTNNIIGTHNLKQQLENILNKISNNIQKIENYSFEFELNKLSLLTNITINSNDILSPDKSSKEQITNFSKTLDNIAFNTTKNSQFYEVFNEEINSKIITKSIIRDFIISILDTLSKDESQTNTLINNLLTNIKDNINTTIKDNQCKLFTWSKELPIINQLSDIKNQDSITIETINNNIATTLDTIAFNYYTNTKDYIDVIYTDDTFSSSENYSNAKNSLFITRTNILEILETFTIADPSPDIINIEDITNDILLKTIANIKNKTYLNIKSSFDESNKIIVIKNQIFTDLSEKTLNEKLATLDTNLSKCEKSPICGPIITRKMNILILDEIKKIITNDTIKGELDNKRTELIARQNSTNSENYDTEKYFEKLNEKLSYKK